MVTNREFRAFEEEARRRNREFRALDETDGNVEFDRDRRNESKSVCVCGSVITVAAKIFEENSVKAMSAEGVGCETRGVNVFSAMCN
jgi:hypothetical protein